MTPYEDLLVPDSSRLRTAAAEHAASAFNSTAAEESATTVGLGRGATTIAGSGRIFSLQKSTKRRRYTGGGATDMLVGEQYCTVLMLCSSCFRSV